MPPPLPPAPGSAGANGKTVGSVWERSVNWLQQNLPPPVDDPVGGEPFELWQQAQDLVSSRCTHTVLNHTGGRPAVAGAVDMAVD